MVRIEGRETDAAAPAAPKASSGARRSSHRYKLRTATPAAQADEVERHNLQFSLREQIAYHAIREQALARLARLLTGVQVLLGTSAIASMGELLPVGPVVLLTLSAIAGVILLVVDPSGAARDHRALRSRYHNVLADVSEAVDLRALQASKERISADAPPAYRCVQAIAFNSAVNAMYSEEEAAPYRYAVGFWRRVFANWVPMRGFKFEMESMKGAR